MMENPEAETRMTIFEARLAFCEQRLASIERFIGSAVKMGRPRKRDLTPEERKAVRARLIAGQEKARARREAEAKSEAKAARKDKKESDSGG